MTGDLVTGASSFGPRLPLASDSASVAAARKGTVGAKGTSAGTPANSVAGRRAAKAVRDFQAVFLMEVMKPLTQALSGASSETSGEAAPGLSSGADVYSYFWGEALARHLAGALPGLPGMTEIESPAAGGVGVPGRTRLPRSLEAAVRQASAAAIPAGTPAFRGATAIPNEPLAAGVTLDAISSLAALRAAGAAADATGVAAPVPAVSTAPHAAAGLSAEIHALAGKAGRLFSLPENLVRAVVAVESGGRTGAVSGKGAVGLMQLMPGTAKEMGVKDITDAWDNLVGGARYLARQLERFGTLDQALAAYNAGPGAVEKHSGVPPYPETRAYVRRVLSTKAGLDRANPAGA